MWVILVDTKRSKGMLIVGTHTYEPEETRNHIFIYGKVRAFLSVSQP